MMYYVPGIHGVMLLLALLLGAPASSKADAATGSKEDLAKWILAQSGIERGICFDVGCGDATLALAIARQSELWVQCLDSDAKVVDLARRTVDKAGVYGSRVVADRSSLTRLAYPSSCANLIICGDEFVSGKAGRDFKEIYRILSPRGAAVIGRSAAGGGTAAFRGELEAWLKAAEIETYNIVAENGVWAVITRERPAGADEWTHRNHDAANTFSSMDTATKPPFRLQWFTAPTPTLASAGVLWTGGRQFIIGPTYGRHPEETPSIHALDAYSGAELWERVGVKDLPINRLLAHYSPEKTCSDIAATADSLYVLGGELCHRFDAGTGKTLNSWPIPSEAGPEEKDIYLYLSLVGETLFCAIGPSPKLRPKWYGMGWRGTARAVFALDRLTGKVRWANSGPALANSLVVGKDRICFLDPGFKFHAVDAKTGKSLFAVKSFDFPADAAVILSAYYRNKVWVLYQANKKWKNSGTRGRKVVAFSIDDGSVLHKKICLKPTSRWSLAMGRCAEKRSM